MNNPKKNSWLLVNADVKSSLLARECKEEERYTFYTDAAI